MIAKFSNKNVDTRVETSSFLTLKDFLKKQKFLVLIAMTLALGLGIISSVIATLVGPSLQMLMNPQSGKFIDLATLFGPRISQFLKICTGLSEISLEDFRVLLPLFLISIAGLKFLFSIFQWLLWEALSEDFARKIRRRLVSNFLIYQPSLAKKDSPDEVGSRLTSALAADTRILKEYMVHFWGGLPREGIQAFFLALTLIFLSPELSFYFIGMGLPVVILVQRVGKKLRRRSQEALRDFGSLTEYLQQRFLGMETIKQVQTEKKEEQSMVLLSDALLNRYLRALRVKSRTAPIVEGASGLIIALLLYLSLTSVQVGDTATTVQISFFATLALLSQSTTKLAKYFNSNREGGAASSRLEELFDLLADGKPKEPRNYEFPANHLTINPHVYLNDVQVNYYSVGSKDVLNVKELQFDAGQVHLILGPSGSGKSTLLKVLAGLNPGCTRGKILWNGKENTIPIAYVPQHLVLAPLNLAQNVSYPTLKPDMERVYDCLKRVNLTELWQRDQALIAGKSFEANNFSGGQLQRIFLARAQYHQDSTVLIDEGTSALDPVTERLIYEMVLEWTERGRLVIMVAHRLAALKIADRILCMANGQITFNGSKKDFLASEHSKTSV